MNVLPRVNFLSMMIPLSPSPDWGKIDKLLRGYIWNNGHPKIKHQSFQLRPVMAWLDGRSCVSWKSLENNLVHPRRLEDI